MWIKICGMTSEEAVAAALSARVDAIGFVFAPSVRALEPWRAAQLAAPARGRVSCIAVTLHPQQQLVDQILTAFAPDALQGDLADLQRLRLPSSLALLPVLRAGAATPGAATPDATARDTLAPAPLPPRVLFEGSHSGRGVVADWQQAARLARSTQLVLAGGLGVHNIAAAIGAVRPFGVDVSSGVESTPGNKSPQKISEFVQAARAAYAGTNHDLNHHPG
jgi:phosphoribosylanthranilate isomerase